jgi:hypothetical protein
MLRFNVCDPDSIREARIDSVMDWAVGRVEQTLATRPLVKNCLVNIGNIRIMLESGYFVD